MHDTIEINNLTVNAIVGIYPQERITPQPLVFNITIETDLKQVALRRSLDNGLDYAAIAQDITDFTLATEPELLEPFAEEVANRIVFELHNFIDDNPPQWKMAKAKAQAEGLDWV